MAHPEVVNQPPANEPADERLRRPKAFRHGRGSISGEYVGQSMGKRSVDSRTRLPMQRWECDGEFGEVGRSPARDRAGSRARTGDSPPLRICSPIELGVTHWVFSASEVFASTQEGKGSANA